MAKTTQPLVISYLRFSSAEQAKGDSIRRQIEKAEKWAKARNWTISKASFSDEATSAFRGANAADGNLGRFLSLVDAGHIERGTYLIIENFDRLSRQALEESVALLLNIINKGIVVVALSDPDREYRKGSMDLTAFILAIAELSRSNSESKIKSERVGAAWREKKQQDATNGKVITKALPAWLEVVDGKIVANKAKAAIVKEIYQHSLNGKGRNQIVKLLNLKYGQSIARAHWSDTYVLNILRNRAVLGEYQPHKNTYVKKGNREILTRVPEGDPIVGYYPRIIPDETFYAVQAALNRRRRTGGKVADTVPNIFQGILTDGDGHSLISKSSNQWRRYYISSARDGRSGKSNSKSEKPYIVFPAEPFDYCVLNRLMDLDLFRQNKQTDYELEAIDGRIAEIDAKLVELAELMSSSSKPMATFLKAAEKLEGEKAGLEQQRDEKRGQSVSAFDQHAKTTVGKIFDNLNRVLLGKLTADERIILREVLRSCVRKIEAHFMREGRDYLASLRIQLQSGLTLSQVDAKTGKSYETDDIYYAFRLNYIDYRQEGYNEACPYQIKMVIGDGNS